LDREQPTLTTERLTLVPIDVRFARDLQSLAGAWEVASTTANIPYPYLDGAAEQFIAMQQQQWREDRGGSWHITLDGALVGGIGLHELSRHHRRCSLGYWITHTLWRRGYATEAARAVVEYAFADGIHRLESNHLTRNPASGRVMQKIGMRHEGTLRGYFRRFDKFEDIEMYSILSTDPR
jgi:RimJ/RimL family protein N-acetyltransferase